MVLEEQPAKVAEAVKLFLQGLGYIMRPRKAASTQVKKNLRSNTRMTAVLTPFALA